MPNMVELIKKAAIQAVNDSMPPAIMFGTVTNTEPLKINVEQRLTLNENHLILTSSVSNFTQDAVEYKFALTVGEKVILLRIQGGQKFIVLDRIR